MPTINYITADAFTNPDLNIDYYIKVTQPTLTSISVDINDLNMTQQPTSYIVTTNLLDNNNNVVGASNTVTVSSLPTVITGLTAGKKYRVTVKLSNSNGTGRTSYVNIQLNEDSFNSQVISTGFDQDIAISKSKSFLTISNSDKTKTNWMVAYRNFNSISIPTAVPATVTSSLNGKQKIVNAYPEATYYAFGTTFFMPPTKDNPTPSAGLGFFIGDEFSSGYAILIDTTAAAAKLNRKTVTIGRIDGKSFIKLKTSQVSPSTTLDAIYRGQAYALDLKVKLGGSGSSKTVEIVARINGFKITAKDTTPDTVTALTKLNIISNPTQAIGIIARNGTTAFDYVYGYMIEEEDFIKDSFVANIYQGQFSNDFLNTAYGNFLYSSQFEEDGIENAVDDSVEEFGTVVREIHKVNTKFDRRPAYPLTWSTLGNKFAKIVGSKISNFGGEAFVLNNSSTTIPLADGENTAFAVYGNDISMSGELEYSTKKDEDLENAEPIIFSTSWLQNIKDVERLANWIKASSKRMTRGRIVEIEMFGNPLLEVGDVITINYPYNGYNVGEKFIITNISHSFEEGLTTSIKCRTL